MSLNAPRIERWESTDDHGNKAICVIDYDANDCTLVAREFIHELLRIAGLRLKLEATEGDDK